MKLQKQPTALLILLIVFLLGCKAEKGDVGPAGATGPVGPAGPSGTIQDWAFKEGSMKFTATGALLDETPFSYSLNFQGNYLSSDNGYTVEAPDETSIIINKTYAGDGDVLVHGNSYIEISVKNLSDLSDPSVKYFSLDFVKDLGNNKYHSGSYYWYSGNQTASATVSDLTYNSSTGILSGNYTVSIPASLTRGSLTITNGTFSSKISNVVARKAAY